MSSHSRVYYMDNLRAFAMLLGVFFHASLAYGPMLNQLWLTASADNSVAMDWFAYFSHTFRMPLFFIIAGFFAALLFEKHGLSGLIKNRIKRIALPFIIFLPLVLLAFIFVVGWGLEHVDSKSPMLNFIALMAQNPDAPKPPLTTTHLWFLYNLMFFYVLTAVVITSVKRDLLKPIFNSPTWFVVLGPLLLVPALVTQHAPIPAPEQFVPKLWSFGFYGLFYLFGWRLFKHQNLLEKLIPYQWLLLAFSLVAYCVFHYLIPQSVSLEQTLMMAEPPQVSVKQVGVAMLEAYIGLYMSLFLLVWGRRKLNQSNKLLKYVADSSYWVYIIHLPVLWLIQFALLDTQYPMVIQFLVSTIGTLLIGLISYALFVRWTPLGWLLNGRKKQPSTCEIRQ